MFRGAERAPLGNAVVTLLLGLNNPEDAVKGCVLLECHIGQRGLDDRSRGMVADHASASPPPPLPRPTHQLHRRTPPCQGISLTQVSPSPMRGATRGTWLLSRGR